MTVRKHPTALCRRLLLAAAILTATGCSNSAKPDGSAWTPDPKLVDQLKRTGEIGAYGLSLPHEFTALEVPRGLPGNMKMASWKGPARPDAAPGSLIVALLPDDKAVAEASKNMRQFLVNFSAGVTDSGGTKIVTRGPTESGTLGGIGFSRFGWSGSGPGGSAAQGFAYGAIDNGQVIAFVVQNFGASAATENKLLEAALATFKKR